MATPTLSFAEPFDTSEGHRNDGFIQQTYNQINTSHFVPTDRLDEALDELIVQAENAGWEIELLRESELSGSVIYTGVKTLGDGGASIRISGSRGWLLEDGVTFDTSQSVVSVALRS